MSRHLWLAVAVVSAAAAFAVASAPALLAGAKLPRGSALRLALVGGRAALLAPGPGGRSDLFLVPVRVLPGGIVFSAGAPRDVSATRFAAEESLERDGDVVTFDVRLGDRVVASERIDLSGRAPRGTPAERAAAAISNWQRTGDPGGICRQRLSSDGTLLGSCTSDASVDLFRWAVDQARYEILGPARLQRLEHVWFRVKDAADGIVEWAAPPDRGEYAGAFGSPAEAPIAPGAVLPPPPVPPIVPPAAPGEGEWQPRDPAFSQTASSGRPLFWSTYLRPDPSRKRAVVYVTAWDPADLELGMRAGTAEPRSVEGSLGDGRIPREEMDRLAAAFNGGFQTVDGGYGMRVRGERYLPPIPWSSTVVVTEDGRVGLGSWPGPGPDEAQADAPFPSYRQNLHPVVADGAPNPFRRRFWGGVPSSITPSQTNRTGLCLTREGLLAYFWGIAIAPDGLGAVMERVRCSYGMMLDINFANTEFELYRVGRALPDLGRPIDPEWEIEGPVPGRSQLRYRAQRMVRGMSRKGFPRYADAEGRDFMYLLQRRESLAPDAQGGAGWEPLPGRPPAGWTNGRAWRFHPTWALPAWDLSTADVPEPFGLVVAGRSLRTAVPGLPTLALYRLPSGGMVARMGRWGEDLPAGATHLIQGERARAGEPCARVDEVGFVHFEPSCAATVGAMWLAAAPERLSMVPADREPAFRLFPEVRPVSPRLWFADHWRRAEALGIWGDVDVDSARAVVAEGQ